MEFMNLDDVMKELKENNIDPENFFEALKNNIIPTYYEKDDGYFTKVKVLDINEDEIDAIYLND